MELGWLSLWASLAASYDTHELLIWLVCSLAMIIIFSSQLGTDFLHRLCSCRGSFIAGRRLPLPPAGPRGLPIVGHLHLLGAVPHRSLHKMAQKYGPIFRIRLGSRCTLVISSPSLAKQFLHHHDHSFSHRPPSQFFHLIFYGSQASLFMDHTDPRWKAIRSLYVQHILSPKSIASFQRVRHEEMSALLHDLRSVKPGSPVEIRTHVFEWLLNVMTRLVLSERVRGGPLEEYPESAQALSEMLAQPLVADFMPFLHPFFDPGKLEQRVMREGERMDAMLQSVVKKRLAHIASTGSAPSDVLTTLLQFDGKISTADSATDQKLIVTSYADSELGAVKAILLELLAAGTDSTTALVEWAMAEMLCYPETILRRLKAELNATTEAGQQVEERHLSRLPYLEAVLKESLRMHPPISTLIPHFSKKDTEVAGYCVPGNTILIANAWAIGRDPRVWKDAHVFKPERFLKDGSDEHINLTRRESNYELLAFGKGRRSCPAQNLALLMASLAVANLVHNFEWHCSSLPDLHEKMSAANVLAQPLVPNLVAARQSCV